MVMANCPFCGSEKIKIDKKSVRDGYTELGERVERHTFSVRCNRCYARGPAVGGRVIHYLRSDLPLPKWATTDKTLEERAVEAWNRRAQEKNDPLVLDELRQMDGQPVFIEHDILPKFNHVWVVWNNQVSDDIHDGLDGYGIFWRAYRYPPIKEET